MPAGSLTLADVAGRTADLAVACTRCDRAGRYHMANLIARHGSAETPEMVETTPSELHAVLDAARADGVSLCVIDTRPSAGADTATAAALADLVLIPTRPAIFDLKAIGATVDIVASAKVPAFIVLNGTPAPRGFGEASATADARRALADYGIPVAPISIGLRAALAHALVDGRAVNEFDPAGKAALEMNNLWQLTEKQIWPNVRRSAR